jgi:predicted TIM-barrel fold metal-dependent hydrolase
MKIIDAHTHVFPQYAGLAVQVMDRCGVECCVTLEWHDGFGPTLIDHLEIFNRYPGRFVVFGNVDFGRINEPGFGRAAAEGMARDVEAGMRGLKVYKALGLEYRDEVGELWRVDDERLDPIWAKASELGIPVLIHTADPVAFWQPVDDDNFWNGVLHGEYAWWSYFGKDLPGRDELIAARNTVVRRHPATTFIAPHVGSRADSLDLAAEDLDALPNLFYDFSARAPILGLPGSHAERARQFFIDYQDRILFGTDSIYDDTNVPTGMQAQCLHQPGEIALDGADPRDKYVETSAEFLRSHIDFLTTDRVQDEPPFRRTTRGFRIQGLGLPEDICAKLMWSNVERLLSLNSI